MDLSRLIDEVLDMAKKRQGQRATEKWNESVNKRHMQSETNEAELKKQRLINEGQIGVQELRNTGALGVQEAQNRGGLAVEQERSTGALARERLGGQFKLDVANIESGDRRYGAELGLKGHELSSGATIKASENRLMGDRERAQAERDKATISLGLAKNDPISSFMTKAMEADPSILSDPKRWKGAMENARSLTVKEPTPDEDRQFFQPATSAPAPSISPARTALTVAPKRSLSTQKDVPWNAKPPVFGEAPRMGLNERTTIYTSPSQQEEEERNRKKKRLFGF